MDYKAIADALLGRPGAQVQDRGYILPMVKTERGLGLGWPEMARDAWKAVALPKAALEGYQATPEDVANFALTVGVGGLGASAATGERGGLGMFKAYHGSPHDFDKFSMDKIGTGEGAQAYGHGLYFAENEGVARSYRNSLAMPAGDPVARMVSMLEGNGSDVPAGLRRMFPRITDEEIQGAIDRVHNPSWGHMYEVNINAEPEDFLDWDKPLSEQSGVLEKAGFKPAPWPYSGWQSPDGNLVTTQDAESLYRSLGNPKATPFTSAHDRSKAQASARLREAGIPGIRYLDQGSRGAGEGSHNYVVFDDSLINIARKYGLTLPGIGVGGMAMGSLYGHPKE